MIIASVVYCVVSVREPVFDMVFLLSGKTISRKTICFLQMLCRRIVVCAYVSTMLEE